MTHPITPRPTVVIAHELITYSSLLADALTRLRPCFDVHHVPALDLDTTITFDGPYDAVAEVGERS